MMTEQIVFMVPEGTRKQLDELAKRNERTVSQELRLMIREFFERMESVEKPDDRN